MHCPAILNRIASALAAVLLLAAATGCAARAAGPGAAGDLVIIGGGLSAQNAEIYERMIALAGDGVVGIVPTATGVPDQSIPSAIGRFEQWGGEGRAVAIDIRHDQPEEAANPHWAALIDECMGLFFTGGNQSRIIAAFRPEEGDTISFEATMRLLRDGGFISGSSAGAAMMSDPMITGGSSAAALRGRLLDSGEGRSGVGIGRGMGYFPYGLVDQHFLTRGRLGRLIVALEQTGQPVGWGIEDNRALHADLRTGMLEALGGQRAVLAVDISRMRNADSGWSGIRLSLMNSGDRWDTRSGAVVPADGRAATAIPASASADPATSDNVWGRHAIPDLMIAIANGEAPSAQAFDEHFEIRLSADARTSVWILDEEGAEPTIVGMRMDIVPLPEARSAE